MGLFDRLTAPPTKDQFAELLMAGIRRAGETREIVYDPSQFYLTIAGDSDRGMYLNNVYTEFCSVPRADREKTLSRVVRNWFVAEKTIPDDFQDAAHDLLPVVREQSYFTMPRLMLQLEDRELAEVPYQPLGENLAIALVYDLPEAMRTIGQTDLDNWGVTLYEALEVARDNLAKLPCSFIGPQTGEGVYLSVTNDNYDACRLLLLDTIRQFRVKGDHVAMVPNRDTLIVTGADDVEGIKGMLALAKEALQKPRPMAGLALTLDGDEWVAWMPPASHPCYAELRAMRIQTYGHYYGEQKELLDQLNKKNNIDIFVASFTIVQNQATGELWSYSVWPKDCLTLLPQTDKVAFAENGKAPRIVDWDRVVATVGDMLEPTATYPERYRVSEFPTEEQLGAMEPGCGG